MENKCYTISEITLVIKKNLERNPNLNNIWIKGEIYNLTYHSSGHIYFTLKDENAVIAAVFFRYANKKQNFKLEEGMNLLALGSINVFEKRGNYQFIVEEVKLEGIGELQKKIEQLKQKLLKLGIFDTIHKKKIPSLPLTVGVVTSPTGAAIRDIIKVAIRKFPNIRIIIAPVKVQGRDAALSIVRGIEELNNLEEDVDIIIVARGGGSFEDLMPFNEEIVVRSFFNSRIPIISAVGHQIDHPLCDDAADYAAPTPSAAAEIAIPVKKDIQEYIINLYMKLYKSMISYINELNAKIDGIMNRRIFRNPREIIYNKELVFSDIENKLISKMKDRLLEKRTQLLLIPQLSQLINNLIREKIHRYNIAIQGLSKLSPINTLERGYSFTTDIEGKIIKTIKLLNKGDIINLILFDGSANCTVNSIKKEVKIGEKRKINLKINF